MKTRVVVFSPEALGDLFDLYQTIASAAYLTVSEIFPSEIRGIAIAIFYAAGTLIGGVGALPLRRADRHGVAGAPVLGYVGRGVLMVLAAGVEASIGVEAEGQSLESITKPLSAVGSCSRPWAGARCS